MFLVPRGLSRINVLLASYCWSQTTVPRSSIKASRFETQPWTVSSAPFLWATIYWPSITSPHPGSQSLSQLLCSLYPWQFQYLILLNLPVDWPFSSLTSSPPNISYSILHQPLTLMGIPTWSCPYWESYSPQNLSFKHLSIWLLLFILVILYYFICIYLYLPSLFHFLILSPEVTTVPSFVLVTPLIIIIFCNIV